MLVMEVKLPFSLDIKREYISIDEDDPEGTNALQGCSKHNYKDQDRDDIAFSKPYLVKLEPVSGIKTETSLQGKCTLAASPIVILILAFTCVTFHFSYKLI